MRLVKIRRARMDDVRAIHALLSYFAERRELLPRSLSEIYENLQQFFVAVHGDKVVGCCALYVTWAGLAEVKALAVAQDYQRKGIGKRLLKTTVEEAKKLGVDRLFTLTIREGLFRKFGFRRAPKSALPHKVWTECVRCPYFPDTCIETSLTLHLTRRRGRHEDATRQFMASSEPMVPSEPVNVPSVPPPPPDRLRGR